MPDDVYVKMQTVAENIISLTTYESTEEIEKAVKSARYKEDQWIGGIFDALVLLREIPAADVEPVRHGRWIECKHEGQMAQYCSECGSDPGVIYIYKRCPECGAYMDKEEEDGTL